MGRETKDVIPALVEMTRASDVLFAGANSTHIVNTGK